MSDEVPRNAIAATRPVNPHGAVPVLTEAQLWAGLHIKLRSVDKFVEMVTSCNVVEDSGNKIVREIVFPGSDTVISEPCFFFDKAIARGFYPQGGDISDIIAYGPDGELWLTFACCGIIPGPLAEGNPPAPIIAQRLGTAIDQALVKIRQLVQDGTIKA